MNGSDRRSGSVSFGQMLRRLRHDARLSQEELAELAGLSAKTISNLERGCRSKPYRSSLEALATALGLKNQIRAVFLATGRGQPRTDNINDSDQVAGSAQSVATDHQREAAQGPVQEVGTARPVQPPAPVIPRTLPRDIASFTGRAQELDCLARVLEGAGFGRNPGHRRDGRVGKTTFSVHAAHLLAPRFPDGEFFLPLHGHTHTSGRRPVEPADPLASLLTTMGEAPARIPPGLEERAALWRDHMAGRQVLLVLDDAVGSVQVRPLLPGAAGSLVLVTSRRHLTALEDLQPDHKRRRKRA